MTTLNKIALGILLILGGIWVGAWICDQFDSNSPFHLAGLLTGTLMIASGIFIIVWRLLDDR